MYQPGTVQQLFDKMAVTYRWHSMLDAGLTAWWRRQLVALLPLRPGLRVIDLMTGTGELWPRLLPKLGATGRIRGVDFSGAMLDAAAERRTNLTGGKQVSLHQADACSCGLATSSADVVVSAFGLKTLPPTAYASLATEIARLLVAGGTVALLELTVPPTGWRRWFCLGYMWALNQFLLARGGPMAVHTNLRRYARRFGSLEGLAAACREAGLVHVEIKQLPLGVASVLVAKKPA